MAALQTEDAVAGAEPAVANLEVEPPEQRRQRVSELGFSPLDDRRACRLQRWQRHDHPSLLGLFVFAATTAVLTLKLAPGELDERAPSL
jgi:hypothetical protein